MNEEAIIKRNKLKRAQAVNSSSVKIEELPKKLKYFKGLISRSLLAIIFVLVSIIFTNVSPNNKELYQEYILTDSLGFTKINNLYESIFGKVDFLNKNNEATTVFKNINYKGVEDYKNGVKLTVNNGDVINVITSGIIVYIGEKEDLGHTIIIQGNDGCDIWYSNVADTNINIYDYVESGSILGTSNSDFIYLTIMQDGEYLTYEEYQKLN